MITIKTSLKTIDTVKEIAKLGQLIFDEVLLNIKNGVNNDGQVFIPYEKSYQQLKGSAKVDLKVTGRLLSSLKLMFKSTEIIIGVVGDRNEVAEYLNQHKNWSFLTWGKLLSVIYDKYMQTVIEKALTGGSK